MTRDAHVGRLDVEIERDGGAFVVRAQGEVDLNNAEQLATGLRSAHGSDEPVILDLIGVPFMDSSGLRVLLLACEELGDRLALVMSPGSPIASLLDLAGVGDRFSMHPTPAAAIDAGARTR